MLLLQIFLWSSVSIGFFIGLMNIPSEAEQRKVVRQHLKTLKYLEARKQTDDMVRWIETELTVKMTAFQKAIVAAGISMKDLERNLRGLQARS